MPIPTREEKIAGLRALAAYLEAHPEVPVPVLGRMYAFATKDKLRAIARALRSATKTASGDYFALEKSFGPVILQVNFPRDQVCRRVVVGVDHVPEKTIPAHIVERVEWFCPESLLRPERPEPTPDEARMEDEGGATSLFPELEPNDP